MKHEQKNNSNINITNSALIPMPQLDEQAGRKLTSLQKVAEATNGIVTPANIITATGVVLTGIGCCEFVTGDKVAAVGTIAVGAVCDALDGQIARRTRTANYRVGRYADAISDGVKSAILAGSLYVGGVYPAKDIIANYGPKVLGWGINTTSVALGNEAKTNRVGKIAEVARWLSPGLAVAKSMLYDGGYQQAAELAGRAGTVATIAACALGLVAAAGYTKDLIINTKRQCETNSVNEDTSKTLDESE